MCGSDRAGRLGGEADWSRMRVDIGIMTFIMHRLVRAGGKDGDVAGAERGFAFVSDPHGFAVEHDDAVVLKAVPWAPVVVRCAAMRAVIVEACGR